MYQRFIQNRVLESLKDTPVVLTHGPRQPGKTTFVKSFGEQYQYVDFDNQTNREAAKEDPVGFIQSLGEFIVFDEIQRVPEVFISIKESIDEHTIPFKFISIYSPHHSKLHCFTQADVSASYFASLV